MELSAERIRKNESFSENGIAFVDVSLEGLALSGEGRCIERINEFYKGLCDAFLSYAREKLCPKAKGEYESSSDERKRFSYRPYRCSMSVVLLDETEQHVSVLCKFTFTKRSKVLYEGYSGQVWEKKRGRICPLKVFLKKEYRQVKRAFEKECEVRGVAKMDKRGYCFSKDKIMFFPFQASKNKQIIIELERILQKE